MDSTIRFVKGEETRTPTDFKKALRDHPKAQKIWDDITPLARTEWIYWVVSGKREETRAIRIEKAISKLTSGMRRPCCFAGVTWST